MGGRILEFSADKYFYAGEAKGRIEGEAKALKEGEAEGQKKVCNLITKLIAEGKMDEMTRAATDEDYRNTLFRAYAIE